MRRFFAFSWLCLKRAFPGNAAFANDWQWAFGSPLVSGFSGLAILALGALTPSIARHLHLDSGTTGYPPIDSLIGALAAFLLTWLISFLVRLALAPSALYYEQLERADLLSGSPSPGLRKHFFKLGYDPHHVPADVLEKMAGEYYSLVGSQDICRIWVENVTTRPIQDCRVVVESFVPDAPIRKGAYLVPENRKSGDHSSQFDLAGSERRYFAFLSLSREFHTKELQVLLHSDEDNHSPMAFLDRENELEVDRTYIATVAVHGKEASSERISITINVKSVSEVYFTSS